MGGNTLISMVREKAASVILQSSSRCTRALARSMAACATCWKESVPLTCIACTLVNASTASTARPPAVMPFSDKMIALDCKKLLVSDSAADRDPVTRLSITVANAPSMVRNSSCCSTICIAACSRRIWSCSAFPTILMASRSRFESLTASNAPITIARTPPCAPATATAVGAAGCGKPPAARTSAA